jgi:predicted nucleic acid-binding protein
VFVDTSAYFASVNRRDAAHEQVAALMHELVSA